MLKSIKLNRIVSKLNKKNYIENTSRDLTSSISLISLRRKW